MEQGRIGCPHADVFAHVVVGTVRIAPLDGLQDQFVFLDRGPEIARPQRWQPLAFQHHTRKRAVHVDQKPVSRDRKNMTVKLEISLCIGHQIAGHRSAAKRLKCLTQFREISVVPRHGCELCGITFDDMAQLIDFAQ